jgi:hypothetical protein
VTWCLRAKIGRSARRDSQKEKRGEETGVEVTGGCAQEMQRYRRAERCGKGWWWWCGVVWCEVVKGGRRARAAGLVG